MLVLANIIHRLIQLFILLILIQSILTYFMAPYHPVRMKIDSLMEPIYRPIRRMLPPAGAFDFSPLVLIIALYVLDFLISQLLLSLAS